MPSENSTLTSVLLGRDNSDEDEKMGVDEMLCQYVGEFGPWQLRHFVLVSLVWVIYAFHTMVMIFADREPAWRCVGITDEACRSNSFETICQLEPGSWEWVGGPGTSTMAEWGLVCSERYKVGLAQSAYFVGCMIGCGIFGHLSDSFLGRKGTLTTLCVLSIVFGSLTAASPSYIVYVVLRTLTGMGSGAMGPCCFILATEVIGPTSRAAAGMSVFYFFSAGITTVSSLAYFVPSWRVLYLVSSLPTLLFLVAVLPFVSESPRWHLIRGNSQKAMETMRSIAKRNGRYLPHNLSLVLDNGKSDKTDTSSSSILDVIRSPMTRGILAVTVIIDFLCSNVYYGLNLNVTNLHTNIYLSTAGNAVSEMPAFMLTAILLNRIGRKPLLVGTMWLSGAVCVVGSFLGDEGWGRMCCGMVGVFGMAATFNLLVVYGSELFPTSVRSASLGCMQQAVQMGAIVAPMVVPMGGRTALAVFGVCGVVGGILSFCLPETLNKPLYDTMAGMEEGEKVVEELEKDLK